MGMKRITVLLLLLSGCATMDTHGLKKIIFHGAARPDGEKVFVCATPNDEEIFECVDYVIFMQAKEDYEQEQGTEELKQERKEKEKELNKSGARSAKKDGGR